MNVRSSTRCCGHADLLARFGEAWGAGDVDAIMACFHSNAVYFASVGPEPGEEAKGTAAIRQAVQNIFEHDGEVSQTVSAPVFFADMAFWSWTYRHLSGAEVRGCDLFKFKDGLILLKDAYRKTYPETPLRDQTQ